MKKRVILTILASAGMATGVFAQGSLNLGAYLSNLYAAGDVVTQNPNGSDVSTATGSVWYNNPNYPGFVSSGNNFSLDVWFTTATLSQAQLDAINGYLNQTGGSASAIALLGADGMSSVTGGAVDGYVSYGAFSAWGSSLDLPLAPTSVTGTMALVGTAIGGTYDGWQGVLAFSGQNTGGNPNGSPPGTTANLTGWNNMSPLHALVLSPTVPEPATFAMLGLGALSTLWMFRRRK